ncbi:uncharacterized protein J7T54_002109 [Emericellopsis cladophorae]|uniref:PH domain-containing protein n=1 Tax=Emericellopsis cladophorae TaxID=2686198 RepID=A0A9P9Y3P3_9HYPO|nr:uncharacterized protein J7T54_002109 [Emericellopsis cladophorae]KAI6782949.1 hypothetical protein J7T54_002109 [Emericellopsis cladophorae]
MDSLQGWLMVPPDRGQILNRAVWKSRFVHVGRRPALVREHQPSASYSQIITTSRIVSSSSKQPPPPPPRPQSEEYYISLFKSKDDTEAYQQWPVSSILECQVQTVAHRKQGPVLPTLLVTLVDRERKRRSSRAGFIPTGKEPNNPMLWFRIPPDEQTPSLQEWARFIMALKTPMSPEDSPITPTSSTQAFSPRPFDNVDYFARPHSGGNRMANRALQNSASTASYSTGTRERPLTFSSGSPSLKSKRSDVSSPSSNYPIQQMANYTIGGQHYTTVLPTDLPSPVNTTGDGHGDFGGWTMAQGRESVSSPHHGRGSLSSQMQPPSIAESSSPPGPRETILDRAFVMRHQNSKAVEVPGEEKLSSVARFDALMREAEDRRQQRHMASRAQAQQGQLRSTFEADDSSESDSEAHDDDDTDSDDVNFSDLQAPGAAPLMTPSTKRALQHLTGRRDPSDSPSSPRPGIARNPISFHSEAALPLAHAPPARPHTAHDKMRRDAQRAQSTQYLPSSFSTDLASHASESSTPRQSSSTTKRLSFTEFTKRLSSTSSLLMVQTNASRGSIHEADVNASSPSPRTTLRPSLSGHAPSRDRIRSDDIPPENRCSWRNNLGIVVPTEGGFF